MITVQELVDNYEGNSNEELLGIHGQIDNYTVEAKEALEIVIKKRGGIENLSKELTARIEIDAEKSRIRNESMKFFSQNLQAEEISIKLSSRLLSQEQVQRIVESALHDNKLEKEDLSIKPRTIFGSVAGGFIGGTIGGIFWGAQMIYMKRMFVIYALGLVILNYGLIRLFTKQSKKNRAVFVATILSVIYALLLGQILYEMIGYRGTQ
ncbi:hypothetical protein ACX0G9_04770 [Flavitalea flava]